MGGGDLVPLLVAGLGGAVVGLERQWSGHADGPQAHFAGIRTFTLVGVLGGTAGQLLSSAPLVAAILIAGVVGLIVAAYVAASRTDVDGTTETAALMVLAAAVLSGRGDLALGSGLATLTAVLLVEKSRLHAAAARLDGADLRAGIRFAALAVVVLPLVPLGPFGPGIGIRPRELWTLVLFFSGLSFAGHIARRALGPRFGLVAAGAVGGVISSTNVTLTFAQASRDAGAATRPLAFGAMAANVVLFPRVLVATAALNPSLAVVLLPWLVAPALAAAAIVGWGLRGATPATTSPATSANPLRIGAALQMAVLFQAVMYAVAEAQARFGHQGLFLSAAALGLTDVDALTVTMARSAAARAGLETAARAIVVGVLANTALKAAIALAIGRGAFRLVTGLGLVTLGVIIAATLMIW